MTYDVSDDELADARELEEATGELRHIAGGPGGWAAGTVMDEYDRLRAELAEAKAEIARLTEQLRLTTIDQFNAEAANSDIVEAATALVEHVRHGMKDFTSGVDPIHGRLEDRLVTAVEEGSKT